MKPGTHVHFIGVGGSGMSGLATIAVEAGMRVTGSDLRPAGEILSANPVLERAGVTIRPHDVTNVPQTGIVVYSKSIPPENIERTTAAERHGVELLSYGEAVVRFVGDRKLIAVAGTHGKSTTTALISHILSHAGWHISFLLGAKVPSLDGRSARFDPESTLFVVEADEYDRTFHAYRPDIAVVTNVDWDHIDTYPRFEDVIESFSQFLKQVSDGGTVVLNTDDQTVRTMVEHTLGHALRRRGITIVESTKAVWDTMRLTTPLLGPHNHLNTLAAAQACAAIGTPWDDIRAVLGSFRGLERRLERVGRHDSATVHSDYAHHPAEILATLNAVHELYPALTPVIVFQPHQNRRLTALFDAFVSALQGIPSLHIVREFRVAGRDEVQGMKTAKDLAETLRTQGSDVVYHESLERAYDALSSLHGSSPIILMGAGDIHTLAKRLTVKPS